MDQLVTFLNDSGRGFCDYAGAMFVQTGMLIAALLLVDLFIHKRVRAAFRYWMWLLVFVKLLLPPTLALPSGVGYWVGLEAPAAAPVVEEPLPMAEMPATVPAKTPLPAREPIDVWSPLNTSPETAAAIQTGPTLTWQAVVFVLWLVGLLVFGLLLVQRAFFVRGLVNQSIPAGASLSETLERCARQTEVRADVRLRISPNTFSPAVCGLIRPVVLLPAALLEKLSGENLRAVLIHELAHIKRGDLWINFAQTILQAVYFYNPLVWLAHALVRRVREQAVDEMVLVALSAEAKSYSNTLIDIAEMAFFRANLALRLIGVAESKKSLEGRIKHMLTKPIPKSAKVGFWGIATLALVAVVLLPMARAQNREARPESFVAHLPGGATVELLGICNWPEGGRQCWRADGADLVKELYATKQNTPATPERYGFMMKITGPQGLNFSWRDIDGATRWEGSCEVEDSQGNTLNECTAAISDMEADRRSTSIRVGVAAGAWDSISSHDGRRMNSGNTGVLWSQAFENADGTQVVASTQWRKDRAERIVAVDLEGTVHSGWCGSVASGNVDQFTARFPDLKFSRIKEFQFQVRPYEWVEFRGVSLRPGTRTKVQVIAGLTDEADYAHAVVEEGVGFDGLVVGGPNCTAELIKSKLGEPEEETKSRETGWWLGYKKTHGLDFWLNLDANILAEIRLNRGFKGRLRSGISMASTKTDVFQVYGPPVKEETVLDLTKHFDNQVLYARLGLRGGSRNSKIFYKQDGLLFWFEGERILQIVIHPKELSMVEDVDALTPDRTTESERRAESARNLAGLGKVLLLHANRHNDRLPANLTTDLDWAEMHPSLSSWLQDNVVYLGRGMTVADEPGRPIAYDKTLLKAGNGTNVLYLDSHVVFESSTRLEELGITASTARLESGRRLSDLGKTLLIWANDHDDTFPDSLEDLRPEVDPDTLQWLREHVQYVGKGRKATDSPGRVLAYDKTLMAQGGGTNVLYLDSHVAFEDAGRLAEIDMALASEPSETELVESATRLSDLGKVLLFYANDHDDKLPGELSQVRREYGVGYGWLASNVAYLGQGMTTADDPARPVAYDKTLVESGGGTNVLYLDSHVAFEHPDQLARLGIRRNILSPLATRADSGRQLANLGKALLTYAIDHGAFPDNLDQMMGYLPVEALAWLKRHAAYGGAGVTEAMPPDTVMAYDKTLLEAEQGTNVLYLDCHVAFETPQRLERLGIRSEAEQRKLALNHLRRLALAALLYAHEHDGTFADDLDAIKPYAGDEAMFAWMQANAKYLGKGVTVRDEPTGRPVAYSTVSDGAAVAFLDGHVEWRRGDYPWGLDIGVQRRDD